MTEAARSGRARLARVLLAIGVAVHVVFLLSLRTHWLDPLFLEATAAYGQAADYFGIHQAGDNLLDGHSIYDRDRYRNEADHVVPYFYFYRYLPPVSYVAAVAARFLDPWTCYWIWVGVNEILLLILLVSLGRVPGVGRETKLILAAVTLAFTPFYLEQWMGQFSFLVAFCLWWVFREELLAGRAGATNGRLRGGAGQGGRGEVALPGPGADPRARGGPPLGSRDARRRGRELAGLLGWTGSLLVKSFAALFAPIYLLRRRWRRVAVAVGVVVLLSLPYYLARPEDLVEFLRLNLKPYPAHLIPVRYGVISLVQFFAERWVPSELPALDLGFRLVRAAAVPVYLWILVVGSVSVAVTLASHRRARTEHLFTLWMLAFFCVYKDIWEYHHVMLLPPLYVLAMTLRSAVPWAMLVWLALPSAHGADPDFWSRVPMTDWSVIRVLVHHASYALPVLGFYLWTVRLCLRGCDADPARLLESAR